MANSYTTSDLAYNINLISHLPDGNNTYTTDKIILLADRELQTSVVAQIQATRGGYYLAYKDYAPSSDNLYELPPACIGCALEDVEIVNGGSVMSVGEVGIQGNFIKVPQTVNGLLRLWYPSRPSRLIPTSSAAQITGVNGATLSVYSLPSILSVGTSVDILGDQPPFNILGTETITAITGTDVTLSNPVTTASVNNWIALQDQTPVPQIPVEFRTLLEQRVVVKIYEMQGYMEKMKLAQKKLEDLEKDTLILITPRIKNKTKIVQTFEGGFLFGNRMRYNRFFAGP